jgi:glutamine amidotransferase
VQNLVIIDYGMANLRSVQKAFERVGVAAEISGDPHRVAASKVVLPGVGAFRDAIARLRETHLDEPICEHVRAGKPFLGICLGLQMLFTTSYEDGVHQGLNLFEGEVVRFDDVPGCKVPHMGWNQLQMRHPSPALANLPPDASVYFVHSYYVKPKDLSLVVAETTYPETPFASAIGRDNVVATQFHPEKSQKIGMTILKQFSGM